MYSCLHQSQYVVADITLKHISEQEMEQIRLWRNEQIEILRQEHLLSKEDQAIYFKTVLLPSFEEKHPRQILLTLWQQGTLIGYCALVHIDWQKKSAEVSFLLTTLIKDESPEFARLYHLALQGLTLIAKEVELSFFTALVYQFREPMIQLLEKEGFSLKERYKKHIFKKNQLQDALYYERSL